MVWTYTGNVQNGETSIYFICVPFLSPNKQRLIKWWTCSVNNEASQQKTIKLITDQNLCLPGYKLLNILLDLHIPPRPCNTQDVINSLNKVLPIPFFFSTILYQLSHQMKMKLFNV